VEKILQITLEGFARRNQSRPTKSEQARGPAMTHLVMVIQVRTEELQQWKQIRTSVKTNATNAKAFTSP
jgi:hypothetical protein